MIFRLFITLFSLFVLFACAESGSPKWKDDTSPYEVSVAYLKSLCKGSHYRIVNDYTVRGIIVATDWLGELNKSAIFVDESGGLEIALDVRDVNRYLPIYSEVTIFCNGLMLARVGGKIELGAPPTGNFLLDNIDSEMLGRYIRVDGVSSEGYVPKIKRFEDVRAEDVSRLVRFDRVRICDAEQGLSWCDVVEGEPITTYRTLVDSEGQTFAVRTLATCHYATEMMPAKEISVIGAIDYSDNRYFLRIVNKAIIE